MPDTVYNISTSESLRITRRPSTTFKLQNGQRVLHDVVELNLTPLRIYNKASNIHIMFNSSDKSLLGMVNDLAPYNCYISEGRLVVNADRTSYINDRDGMLFMNREGVKLMDIQNYTCGFVYKRVRFTIRRSGLSYSISVQLLSGSNIDDAVKLIVDRTLLDENIHIRVGQTNIVTENKVDSDSVRSAIERSVNIVVSYEPPTVFYPRIPLPSEWVPVEQLIENSERQIEIRKSTMEWRAINSFIEEHLGKNNVSRIVSRYVRTVQDTIQIGDRQVPQKRRINALDIASQWLSINVPLSLPDGDVAGISQGIVIVCRS